MSKKLWVGASVIACSALALAVTRSLLLPGNDAATAATAPTSAPAVAPPAAALKMDSTLSSVQLVFKRGSFLLDANARSELDRIAANARAAAFHEIHGKEPRNGSFDRARSLAFNRAFAARMYLADQGVDPKRGRIKFHTLGADLRPGVEVVLADRQQSQASIAIQEPNRLGVIEMASPLAGLFPDSMPTLLRGYVQVGGLRYQVV